MKGPEFFNYFNEEGADDKAESSAHKEEGVICFGSIVMWWKVGEEWPQSCDSIAEDDHRDRVEYEMIEPWVLGGLLKSVHMKDSGMVDYKKIEIKRMNKKDRMFKFIAYNLSNSWKQSQMESITNSHLLSN